MGLDLLAAMTEIGIEGLTNFNQYAGEEYMGWTTNSSHIKFKFGHVKVSNIIIDIEVQLRDDSWPGKNLSKS
jgi:hypothetical protein